MRPGIYPDMAAEAYHADEDGPSLSASIAHILDTRSPLHAWTAQPKLNPDYERETEPKFDLGTCVHALFLQGIDVAHVGHYDNWRSNDAKAFAAEARMDGRIPLLAKDYERVQAMHAAMTKKITEYDVDPPLFTAGREEVTLVWHEDDVTCRARIDWLTDDHSVIEDVKSTSRSAEHAAFARRIPDLGYDLKAAFYLRGLKALTGVDATFRWTVIETQPPYELSVVTPGPDVLALGEAKVERALRIWRECLSTGRWPGYERRLAVAELPGWEETRFLEREAREEIPA
jgi:hypothetical protein